MNTRQESQEMNLAVQYAAAAIRNQILIARRGIVMGDPQLVVESVNEIDKTVAELEWKRIKACGDPNPHLGRDVLGTTQRISMNQGRTSRANPV